MNEEGLRKEYAEIAEYAVWLLELVSVENRKAPLTPEQIDRKLAHLRRRLDPSQVAEAERIVNKIHTGAKKVLASIQ